MPNFSQTLEVIEPFQINQIMGKKRKPLSTKKPPMASDDHDVIDNWISNRIMPSIKPAIQEIDSLIHDSIPNLNNAIKWGSAFYGTKELGWLIEVAAYSVSANIVFLKGASFNPQPSMGSGNESRYVKITSMDQLKDQKIVAFIKQAGTQKGWK